ncbi:IS4 family transposase [Streptomyces paludis]|uniref:IS4 family transposase n=1 Tax=Streptomyces paludis TaxID=2282738 RepID=A0A345HPV0_9ACTN|nr:IS4 family transposase [Streptomyces paludis]AXG78724.1 IS4 family transposase [Streptomyces paludis]AXG78745.1 IS4 family transposase [Streptomyces paludis]AXG79875.1 IS4 family transposase [Streptomyces paludis]
MQSATVTYSRAITVAPGKYAPGHLGELTPYLPFAAVDEVLEEAGRLGQRRRDLPTRVGVYWVLALALFGCGYRAGWNRLTAGLAHVAEVPMPSVTALAGLRHRVGTEPVKALFTAVSGPLAIPGSTPGSFYRGRRVVAFDGCSSIKVRDLPCNRRWLEKIRHAVGWAGYPSLMLMTLVETGTRSIIGAGFGSLRHGERHYAHSLLPLLDTSMLLLADRGFDGNDFLAQTDATGAAFLIRLKSARRPTIEQRLPDGSYLTRLGHLTVRVIEASITTTCADGTHWTSNYRLATNLLDEGPDPAERLLALYHERWEIEVTYLALRHTLMKGRVLSSGTPDGIRQEMWALLTVYQLLRTAMTDAAATTGLDPDRMSFTRALEAAQLSVINATGITPTTTSPGPDTGPGTHSPPDSIHRTLLAHPLPPRRPRTSTRKVKSPISRYHTAPQTGRPARSTPVTEITLTIHHPGNPAPPPTTPPAPPRRPTRLDQIINAIHNNPDHTWTPKEITRAINYQGSSGTLVTQLTQWVTKGFLHKIAHGIYTPPPPTTNTTNP